jgi:hypothetical protein
VGFGRFAERSGSVRTGLLPRAPDFEAVPCAWCLRLFR